MRSLAGAAEDPRTGGHRGVRGLGCLVGVTKRLDIFGVCSVGVFTGIGGGIVRDVLLGVHPPSSLSSWPYFGTAAATSLAVFYLHEPLNRLRREILALDALGMGLFASTGAVIALDNNASSLAATLIGATAAIGGGVIRDVLVNEVPLLLHKDLYAVPALLGAALVVTVSQAGLSTNAALVCGTAFAAVFRLLALWRHWSCPGRGEPGTDRDTPEAGIGPSQPHLSTSVQTVGMRILVVDDDRAVRESLRRSLSFNGYTVELAVDGLDALEKILANRPDAVVLDVMMPRLDGLEVCRRLRSAGDDLPILVLTARDSVSERVAGLDAGADDYLPKPFALEELLARLRALLRRTAPDLDADSEMMAFEDLTLDPVTREVKRGERSISLTRTEFSLLEMLMANPRRVLTRGRILEEVWGYDFPTSGNALEVYVGYLRRKTEADGEPRLIHTVRGVGYVLRETPP